MPTLRVTAALLTLIILIASATARAISAPGAPASQPAGETPKAGLHAYNAAMAAQDMDAMLARTHASTDEQQRVAKALARADMYVGGLLKTAREKFGEADAARLGRAIGDASDATIDAGTETIDGDRAVLLFDRGNTALVRFDGKWKIDIAATLSNANAPAAELIESFSRHGNRAKVVAQEVAAGQFKTIDAVIERMNASDQPTTRD